jgi:hypothetical protein
MTFHGRVQGRSSRRTWQKVLNVQSVCRVVVGRHSGTNDYWPDGEDETRTGDGLDSAAAAPFGIGLEIIGTWICSGGEVWLESETSSLIGLPV